MSYIPIPIETEPVDLAEEAFGYIEQQIPGWLPSPGNLEAWLIEALSLTASELRALVALVPEQIFEFYGTSILGIPPYPAIQATGTTTWTMVDGAGYTVDAGTLVAITPPASSDAYAFQVVSAFSVPAGQTVAAGVPVQALQAGAAGSGITGTVQMLDTLDFVEQVTLDAATAGGSDPEDIDHYLDRLSSLFTILSPRPILPQDFAILAQQENPSVARATAIDLYNLQTSDPACPRCVTVILADVSGNPVPAQVKADVDAMLQAQREVNFLVFVGDPTYTTIDVTCQVVAFQGFDPVQVAALVTTNLTGYLSPAAWGMPPYGDTGSQSWINATTVRYLEVAEQINRTDGVWYIKTLTIGKGGGAQSGADIVMTGVAPMPKPGSIVSTAIPPP